MLHILLHHFKSGDPEQFEGPLEEQCVSSLYVIFLGTNETLFLSHTV